MTMTITPKTVPIKRTVSNHMMSLGFVARYLLLYFPPGILSSVCAVSTSLHLHLVCAVPVVAHHRRRHTHHQDQERHGTHVGCPIFTSMVHRMLLDTCTIHMHISSHLRWFDTLAVVCRRRHVVILRHLSRSLPVCVTCGSRPVHGATARDSGLTPMAG